ncbi:hypothetical protein HAV15_001906 [Penicillium sp. str. |nr:hypothetical protein HAV15_001906 [Penicillium sp. str. \
MEKNKNDHESHSRTMTTIHAKFYLKDTQYRVHARILGTTLVMKVYHGYGDKVHSNLVNMNYATLEDAKRGGSFACATIRS